MRGLPSKFMTIAVSLAWLLSYVPFITYVGAAAITMSAAWYLFKLTK